MAGFLGIARKRSAFYRKRKFLESTEQKYATVNVFKIWCLDEALKLQMPDFKITIVVP